MIELENVTFSYGQKREPSLQNIDLRVADGECVLLAGHSGCGKSTLTRLINGLAPAFYEGRLLGAVSIDGKPVADYGGALSGKVGSVFQNPRSQFFNRETTGEIAFGCENLGLPPEELRRRVAGAARDLGMEDLLDRDIFKLSGGEKQLVAIASVYAMNPDIYVMDEPSANLDMEVVQRLRDIVRELKRRGKTVIIAEHRLFWLRDVADRVVSMREGRIVRDTSMQAFQALDEAQRADMGRARNAARGKGRV